MNPMNYRRPLLDPEVEQLLREVAAQPGSILLRAVYSPYRRRIFPPAPRARRTLSLDIARSALEDLQRKSSFPHR